MTLYVCFCVPGHSALTVCLSGVNFCGKITVGLSAEVCLSPCLDALGLSFLPFECLSGCTWAFFVGGFSVDGFSHSAG